MIPCNILQSLCSLILVTTIVSLLAFSCVQAFDPREATIQTVHSALFSNLTTCRTVVSSFLSRIEAYNPAINAIISLNPHALALADSLDATLASGDASGKLFCIPILLKDNYDAVGMNTTAGCKDMEGSVPGVDAPVVQALRREGAVILGKANLHELALEGLSVSSLGGQVGYIASPVPLHMLIRVPDYQSVRSYTYSWWKFGWHGRCHRYFVRSLWHWH